MNTKFNPLSTIRAIRDDDSLTTVQFAILVAAVLRTDNSSCHVRYSIGLLAEDANMSDKTARTAMRSPEVLKYFQKVERTKRTVDLWFHPEPVAVTDSAGNSRLRGGNSYRPSTLTSTSNTRTSDSATASSPNLKDEELGKGRYEYILTRPLNLQITPEPVYCIDLTTTATHEPEPVTVTDSEDPYVYKNHRYFTLAEVEKARQHDEMLSQMEDF